MANATQAISTYGFLQSIGINAHLGWDDTAYGNASLISQSLSYLGLDNVRASVPTATNDIGTYETLASQGVRFDLLMVSTPVDIAGNLSVVDQIVSNDPGSVHTIEGWNEINMNAVAYDGSNTEANLSLGGTMQSALYSAVTSDWRLGGVGVVSESTGGITGAQALAEGLPQLSGSANDGNWHSYFNTGAEPAANIASAVSNAQTITPGRPVIITESGYSTAPNSSWGGGSADTQAKETLNLVMDAVRDGASMTYIYELFDTDNNPSSSDTEGSFGLFTSNGTAKEAAVAVHNLTTILADNGSNAASFSAGSLAYSISNLPSTGNSLLMEKSNGAFDLAVWNEPTIWNSSTESEIGAAGSNVTVQLGGTYATVEVFDPMSGTGPIETLNNVSQVALTLYDHPLIVEVEPGQVTSSAIVTTGGATAVSTAASSSNTLTTTPDGATTLNVAGGSGSVETLGNDTVNVSGVAAGLTITAQENLTVNDTASGTMSITGGGAWTNVTTSGSGQTSVAIEGNGVVQAYGNDTVSIASSNTGGVTVDANGASLAVTDQGSGGIYFVGGAGTATVQGGGGSNYFYAGAGNETLSGGNGNNVINLSQGQAVVNMEGNTTVTGGSGADTYDFTQGGAANVVINGFRPGVDHVNLSEYQGSPIASESRSSGSTTVHLTDNTTITFVNATHVNGSISVV